MNRALCGKQFKQIGDDSIVNSILIYRRKFSKKWYYFFSTDKEDPPPSNKDWAVSPSVVSNVAPIPVAFKHKLHRSVAISYSLFVKNLLNDMKTCGKEEWEWEGQDSKISVWHQFCTSPCTLGFFYTFTDNR